MVVLISPCHKGFGGWYRADNIARRLKARFIYPQKRYCLLIRVMNGVYNCLYVFIHKTVYVFELVQPETFFPALLARLLGKNVILDIADEWSYVATNPFMRVYVRFIDRLVKSFPKVTVCSDYLKQKYPQAFKLINGVNYDEFKPYERQYAREILGIRKKEKIVLSFGNTFGGKRKEWLDKTCESLDIFHSDVQVIKDQYFPIRNLALWLGASDLVLFPTGDSLCERACFPIRVGSCLNAGRVIATDTSPTEFHCMLKEYDCMLSADTPYKLAVQICLFFKDGELRQRLEKNVLKAKEALDWDKEIGKLKEII